MPATLFRFDDVTVRFGDTTVLDRVSVSTPDTGSITCLLGPSGAGKSTLLRLCNRLEAPSSGAVLLRDEDIASLDPLSLRRRVGMVFQRPTLFPGTVRENLLVARPEASEDAMASALDRSGLDPAFLDKVGDRLSGGEAQRACLARTLVTEPEVLLLDEPTSALDPAATKVLERLGRSLADDGMPLLWVTHDLGQADRIGDDRIVLVGGRLADEHQIQHYYESEDALHHHHEGVEDRHPGHPHETVDGGRDDAAG